MYMKIKILKYEDLVTKGYTVIKIIEGRERIIYAHQTNDQYDSLGTGYVKIDKDGTFYRFLHSSKYIKSTPGYSSGYSHCHLPCRVFCDSTKYDEF